MPGDGTDGEAPGRAAGEGPQILVLLGALLAVTAIAYAGTLTAGFVWDDADWVLPLIGTSPGTAFWDSLKSRQVGGGLAFAYYRPVAAFSFALDGWLWGSSAQGFHLTNLLLYLGCLVLAFLLAKRLLPAPEPALLAAAVFALHPVHVEAVAALQGRYDLLAFAGGTAALLGFLQALEHRPSVLLLGGTGLALLGGLLSKEAALVVPALALACWALGSPERRRPLGHAVRAFVPFLLALAAYGLLRGLAGVASQPPAPDLLPGGQRWLLTPVVFAKYLWLLIWPYPLNPYYVVPPASGLGDPRVLAGMGLGLSLVAAAAWATLRARRIALPLVWFLIAVVPVLPLAPLRGFTMRERYLFLPSFGCALAVGLAWRAISSRTSSLWLRRTVLGAGAALALGWIGVVMAHVPDWVEPTGLYRAMVRVSPESAFAQNNLGQILLAEGNLEEGLRHLKTAVALRPDMAFAHAGLGLAHWRRGDLPQASAAFQAAARLRPQDPRILADLAAALAAQGRWPEAVEVLRRLEELRPGSPEVARQMAAAAAAIGSSGAALQTSGRGGKREAPEAPRKGAASP